MGWELLITKPRNFLGPNTEIEVDYAERDIEYDVSPHLPHRSVPCIEPRTFNELFTREFIKLAVVRSRRTRTFINGFPK